MSNRIIQMIAFVRQSVDSTIPGVAFSNPKFKPAGTSNAGNTTLARN
jgi:hypothetical protein